LVNALAELAALGVAFISLRDNLDLSTPSGRLELVNGATEGVWMTAVEVEMQG
jgi:hypothetical protein